MKKSTKVILVILLVITVPYTWPVSLVWIAWAVYQQVYYKGEKFKAIRKRISNHIKDCNELNAHIEDLKSVRLGVDQTRYGHSDYQDASRWNYKRKALSAAVAAPEVYDCSRSVCDNSRKDPMKYVCKYFGFKADDETLNKFEEMLNDFSAAEDGKRGLEADKADILRSIDTEVPFLIKRFSKKRLIRELGFDDVDLSDAYFPRFIFRYVSSGGNASLQNTVTMDIDNLNAMVRYLNDRIKWRKSVAGQRALMTSALRKKILERDHYTCCQCGVSLADEPHLLLEVDHIVPVSKGGLTSEDNLQTLCWRCNRSKGAKVDA